MTKCLYLGPAGSFCHQAAMLLNEDFDLVPGNSEATIVDSVESGEYGYALVPIENSVEGEVTSTVDAILFTTKNLVIRDEVIIPVTFNIFVKPGVTKIKKVISHPVALAQCSSYINSNHLISEAAKSTSAAAQTVSASEDHSIGAIASPIAGELYGLVPLAQSIEDSPGAHTKFYLLAKDIHAKEPGRDYRTWVALTPGSSRSEAVDEYLEVFKSHQITVTHLSTRLLRSNSDAYVYNFTLEGYIQDPGIQASLGRLIELGCRLRVLGSFPASDGEIFASGNSRLHTTDFDAHKFFAPNNLDLATKG